jgi:hypothetical protein
LEKKIELTLLSACHPMAKSESKHPKQIWLVSQYFNPILIMFWYRSDEEKIDCH